MQYGRGYDHFMNHDRKQQTDDDDAMVQMFGQESETEYHSFNVEDIPVPSFAGRETKGFLIIAILTIVASAILIGKGHYAGGIFGVLYAFLVYFLGKKVRYGYGMEENFHLHNFTVTMRELLKHYPFTSVLMDESSKVLVYSLMLMGIQRIFLSWFAPSSILYAIGFYGFILGVLLNFASRKTQLLRKSFFLYTVLNGIFLLWLALFGGKLDGFTVLSMWVTWYFAGFFGSMDITNPKDN